MVKAFQILIIASHAINSLLSPAKGLPLCGTKKARVRNTYLKCHIMKWENVVPYVLADDLTDKLEGDVKDAIKTWNNIFKNCVEFKPRLSEQDYVTFHGGSQCYSSIGRKPGNQIIMLDGFDCSTFGKIAHEMMHVIGFQHEHMRSDRDKYIKIVYDNIPPDWHNEYRKVKENFHFGELGPYDYHSVMHYRVLSPDSRLSAYEVLTKGINKDNIGKQLNLTDIDKMKVRKLYCPNSNQ